VNAGRILDQTGMSSDELLVLIHPIQPERLWLRAASPVMMRLWGSGIQAMTIGHWIFVDPSVLNGDQTKLSLLVIHELTHVRQWFDLGFFGFLRRYLGDYLHGRSHGLTHRDSYLAIGLEVEARRVQTRFT